MVEQQDVLGLQVRVDEVQVVQEGDGTEQLAREGLNVRSWKWYEATAFQEVEDRET